jgi:uncharacterized protein (TIGR02996 family)
MDRQEAANVSIPEMDPEGLQGEWHRAQHAWREARRQLGVKVDSGQRLTGVESDTYHRARVAFEVLEDQLDQAYRAGVVIAVGGDDQRERLLRQVLAAPRDDGPRLAYADAVQGDDPERAEFIRLQVDESRLSRGEPDQLLGYSDRAFRLRNERGAEWARGIRTLTTSWGYLRGFVGSVKMDATRFLATAPQLFRLAPVEHLHLTGVPAAAAGLFASPYLQRIQALSLPGRWERNPQTNNVEWEQFGDTEASLLAASPHLAGLEWLDLTNNVIGPAGLEALAASANLPSLGYLGFSGNQTADPTPRHADEYDGYSREARELEGRYGHKDWLDPRPRAHWPPGTDEVTFL